MTLEQKIQDFISSPFPIWELGLTDTLVKSKLRELNGRGLTKPSEYSTLGALRKKFNGNQLDRDLFYGEDAESGIYLEHPHSELAGFYREHGLLPCSKTESESIDAISKLSRAIGVFDSVDQLGQSVQRLIWSIHVLRQDDPEIDVSYSHPDIPFSIFLTLCPEISPDSILRVAEGILHEAMHLKLSLIEEVVPMINKGTTHTYFSPWRDELRPVRGVLHGLFVFRAIQEFYCLLLPMVNSTQELDFITWRIEQIKVELSLLTEFSKSRGLTQDGATLAINLSP